MEYAFESNTYIYWIEIFSSVTTSSNNCCNEIDLNSKWLSKQNVLMKNLGVLIIVKIQFYTGETLSSVENWFKAPSIFILFLKFLLLTMNLGGN